MSLVCPFCGAEDEDCVSDVWEYNAGEDYQIECGNCEKTFVLYGEATIDWSTSKPECDGDHEFGEPTRCDHDKGHHEFVAKLMNKTADTEYFTLWVKVCINCDECEISDRLPLYSDKPEDF